MKKSDYELAEAYMRQFPETGLPDFSHIYRVLHNALQLAMEEPQADTDVLVLAALLHDIGKARPQAGKSHAQTGAEMAYVFLQESGFPLRVALHVRDCIASHSRKGKTQPKSLEAKIIYDADKLDLMGAAGFARSLQYATLAGEPLYQTDSWGRALPGGAEEKRSWLKGLRQTVKEPTWFYTEAAQQEAEARNKTMKRMIKELKKELKKADKKGKKILKNALQ